eukprot:FR743081.1.p4 GENE.FR743081.1~~FR743081.1.p4  ORF type:complete len:102 (+),score=67.40 FR743081.1:889-1194(+)
MISRGAVIEKKKKKKKRAAVNGPPRVPNPRGNPLVLEPGPPPPGGNSPAFLFPFLLKGLNLPRLVAENPGGPITGFSPGGGKNLFYFPPLPQNFPPPNTTQ